MCFYIIVLLDIGMMMSCEESAFWHHITYCGLNREYAENFYLPIKMMQNI